jgi:hypothetical protein
VASAIAASGRPKCPGQNVARALHRRLNVTHAGAAPASQRDARGIPRGWAQGIGSDWQACADEISAMGRNLPITTAS